MTNNVKNIFKLLISVVNEVERKLAEILIQNHYGFLTAQLQF
jgi:chemotaxis regulatin CheY-phosphate phosphatase CheZ